MSSSEEDEEYSSTPNFSVNMCVLTVVATGNANYQKGEKVVIENFCVVLTQNTFDEDKGLREGAWTVQSFCYVKTYLLLLQ